MSKMRILGVCVVWMTILALVVLVYKYWWAPQKAKEQQQQAVKDHQETIQKTASVSRYHTSITFAGDKFSGYALSRSDTFKDECGKFGIRLDYKDDGANYTQRLKDLADGKVDMAVFTIDALIKASAEMGDFPATIVCLNDESKGADAIVAAGKKYPNIDSMNNAETKIVCMPNSPSEFLARVVIAHFNLDKLSANPFEFCDSADLVYQRYQKSKPTDNFVYVMWEPYVSKVASNPEYHTLIDSSKFRGYIFDVIVVGRDFLVKNESVVENVVKAHLSTTFAHRNTMVNLVMEDALANEEKLNPEHAERLVKSIWWKNTQETFGHFGFANSAGLQSMEDICRNITDVLIRSGTISKDPTDGKPNMWYYDTIVKRLFDGNWHPGFGNESVREERKLIALKDEEWNALKPVGTLQVPRLVFARGTDKITIASESTLQDLSDKLKTWPSYYLTVKGHASSDGDVEANLKLASARANTAVEWLVEHGVDRARIRAESAKPNGSTTVAFVLGEIPY